MRKSFFVVVVLLCISLRGTTAATGTVNTTNRSHNPLACWLDRILKAHAENEKEGKDGPLPEAQAVVPIVETKSKRESTTALGILGSAVGDGLRLVGGLWLLVEVLDALGCIIPTEDQASNNKNNKILQGLAWMQAQYKTFRSKTLPRMYNQIHHMWHAKFVQASPKHRFGVGAFLGSIFVSNGGLFGWIWTTILWPLGLVYAVSEVYSWSKLRFWMTWCTLSVAEERREREVDDWDFGSLIRDLQKRAGNNNNHKDSNSKSLKRIGHWLDRSIEGFRFQVRKGIGYMLGLSLQDMMMMEDEEDDSAYWDARVEDLLANQNSPSSSTVEKDIAWMSVGGGDDSAHHPLQLAFWKLKEQLYQLQQDLSSFQQEVDDPELSGPKELSPPPPTTTMQRPHPPLVGFRKGILVGILFGIFLPNNNQRRRPKVVNDDNALSSSSSSTSWFSGLDMDLPLL